MARRVLQRLTEAPHVCFHRFWSIATLLQWLSTASTRFQHLDILHGDNGAIRMRALTCSIHFQHSIIGKEEYRCNFLPEHVRGVVIVTKTISPCAKVGSYS